MPASSSALPSTEEQAPHTFALSVIGIPAPQGSKRALGKGVMIEQNKARVDAWRNDVRAAAIRELERTPSWEREYPAISAAITFVLARPMSHHLGNDPARELRPEAARLHSIRPDLDKLLRSTFDALTSAGVYTDDSRIAELWATKIYVPGQAGPGEINVPGARIHLTGMKR